MNSFAVVPRPKQLQARLASHSVAQRANSFARDFGPGHVEELHLGDRPSRSTFDDFRRVRTLNLETIVPPPAGILAHRGALIQIGLDLVSRGFHVIADPVN